VSSSSPKSAIPMSEYPGAPHPNPYVFSNGNLIGVVWNGRGYVLDDEKRSYVSDWRSGFAGSNHQPLLVSGALRNPTRLRSRLGSLADGVAVFNGTMTNVARAWTGRGGLGSRRTPRRPVGAPFTLVGQRGNAEPCSVLIVPVELGAILDRVEGRPVFYQLVRLTQATVSVPYVPVWKIPLTYLGVPPWRAPAVSPVTGEPFLVGRFPNGIPALVGAEGDGPPEAEGWRWLPEHWPAPGIAGLTGVLSREDLAAFREFVTH